MGEVAPEAFNAIFHTSLGREGSAFAELFSIQGSQLKQKIASVIGLPFELGIGSLCAR